MSETVLDTKESKPIVASLGKVERFEIPSTQGTQNQSSTGNIGEEKAETVEQKNAASALAESIKETKTELSDDDLKAILKDRGIDFESFDTLKESLKPKPAEQTEEAKAAIAAAFEKRQIDLFMANGGTVEQFAAIKNVLSMDLKELSITEIRNELKESDFTDEQIEAILQERYYQKNPDELEQGLDEFDEDFEVRKSEFKKKHDYATKKIESRGENIKKKAESVLSNLKAAIEQSDLQRQEVEESEKSISSKVEDYFSNIPKQKTFELGKANDAEIAPVLYDVDDADIAEVKAILKDPEQRNKFLLTTEGNLNVDAVAEMMIENRNLKKAMKVAYLESGSRQVAEFRKTFPHHTAQSLGLGQNAKQNVNINDKRVPVSSGKPQRINTGR